MACFSGLKKAVGSQLFTPQEEVQKVGRGRTEEGVLLYPLLLLFEEPCNPAHEIQHEIFDNHSSSDETLRNFLSFRRETEKFVFCPETNLTQ